MFRLRLWCVFVHILMHYITGAAVAQAEQEHRDREAALARQRQEEIAQTKTKFNTGGAPGPVVLYRRRSAP